ncbi:MAG: DUF4340 domain-containing protein, partial [Deltaproteobacteria bacterium]|nr:DUF4340 domain-containing protein [Deltaproteobacteria bacterium]
LSFFAYHGVYRSGHRQARQQVEARLVLKFDKQSIARLLIQQGSSKNVLIRTGKDSQQQPTWGLVEPVEDEGDPVTINSLLGVLQRMETVRVLIKQDTQELADYGLAPPRARIELTTDQGNQLGLLIGKKNSFSDVLYLQRQAEQDVLVVKGKLERSLLRKTFDLRRKQLMRIDTRQVRKLRIINSKGQIELEKKNDVWQINSPIVDRADQAEVSKILNTIHSLRAISFIEDGQTQMKAYGLDPAGITIELDVGDDLQLKSIGLGHGSLEENRSKSFARRVEPPGPVAEIGRYQISNLDKQPFDLQAKAPLEFNQADVFKIKMASSEKLVVLEKKITAKKPQKDKRAGPKESWSLVSPVSAPAKRPLVMTFLRGLRGLKAKKFGGVKAKLELSKFGLEQPEQSIQLYDENGKEIGNLKVGTSTQAGVWVVGTSLDKVCWIDRQIIQGLFLRPEKIRDSQAK